MRQSIVAGNWKMHGTVKQVNELVNQILGLVSDLNNEIILAPPAIYIQQVASLIKESNLKLAGQNCYAANFGAFTGEISPSMLADFGCKYVILGHSERRQLFAETDLLIGEKFAAASLAGLIPILCIGETIEQHNAKQTLQVIEQQLTAVIDVVGQQAFSAAIIAYEPVWAIGTGLSATPLQAEAVHRHIRAFIGQINPALAEQVRILYGGSVNAKNAADLFAEPNIDGGLIGGAALKAEEFVAICRYAENRVMV